VAVCHAKVGNCQALKSEPKLHRLGFFLPAVFKAISADMKFDSKRH